MPQFEYLTVYVKPSGTYQTPGGSWRTLNELGEQGWEIVSVVNEPAGELVAFFKRLKP